jgi:hypothetical protein
MKRLQLTIIFILRTTYFEPTSYNFQTIFFFEFCHENLHLDMKSHHNQLLIITFSIYLKANPIIKKKKKSNSRHNGSHVSTTTVVKFSQNKSVSHGAKFLVNTVYTLMQTVCKRQRKKKIMKNHNITI